jgi:hypothetical protein
VRIKLETSTDFYNVRWQHVISRDGSGDVELRLQLQGEVGEHLGSLYLDDDGIDDLIALLPEIRNVKHARQQQNEVL